MRSALTSILSQGSLSQKPDTPKVVDSWMPVFARMTVLFVVFPPFSLHKTLESVCPASREPSQGTFETNSKGRGSGLPTTLLDSGPVSGYGVCFRRKDEVGSLCGRMWWYRGWRSFAGC